MNLFDSHAHLNNPEFDNELCEVLERAQSSGVKKIVVVGYDLPSSYKAVELAHKYKDLIYASVGFHPHDSDDFNTKILEEMESLAKDKRVVAIGETGLDFYKLHSKKEFQRDAFLAQLDLANKIKLPLILHVRKAFGEVFKILEKNKPVKGGIFHCFSGGENEARRAVKMGFFVSFSGSITFGSAKLEGALKILPHDRILIETDAHYLAPHPLRGKRNEPSYLTYTTLKVSQILGLNEETLASLTFKNSQKIFKISD